MPETSIDPPTFEAPPDTSNYEIWCLRAPAHLDVSKILDGVTLDVNDKLLNEAPAATANIDGDDDDAAAASNNTNTALARFKADEDGRDYELTIGDASEVNHLRLLVPDNENNKKQLKVHKAAFKRYINLTLSSTNDGQDELLMAPSRENAPRPAFGEMGVNGSVPIMRLAYVPVPQKEELMKRRWQMPGSQTTKRIRKEGARDDAAAASTTPSIVTKEIVNKSAKKKKKKEKKQKKEKKSKKSSTK